MEVTITLKLSDKIVEAIRKLDLQDEMSAMSYQCTTELLHQTTEAVKAEVHKQDNKTDE